MTNRIPGRGGVPDPDNRATDRRRQKERIVESQTPPRPVVQNAPLPRNLIPGRGQTATDPGEFFDPELTFGVAGRGAGSGRAVTGGGGASGGATVGGGALSRVLLNVENAVLVKVNEATGPRYYVEYTVFGAIIRHEIGDQEAFDELGIQDWEQTITISELDFNAREGIDAGLIDERFGLDESYTQTVTRDLRVFGKEDLPAWQRNDPEVMTTLMLAAREGFSPGRTLGLIAETDAFKQQHPNFSQVRGIHTPGASITEAFNFYIESRNQIRDSVRAFRGTEADVTDITISEIMVEGWDPEEVEDILIGEAVLRQMSGVSEQINNILSFQGSDLQITDDNLLDLILDGETDRTPFAVQELINDAIRAQSFQAQGINISPALAEALGTGEAFETLDPNQFGQIAQETATNIFRFGIELQAEREGLTRDDLIRAAVDGTASAQVNATLAKFARRRQIEARGFTVSSQQTGQGRLRLLSTSGL